jgi:hypothetical protein
VRHLEELSVDSRVPGELRMEPKPPDRARAHPDHLVVSPRDRDRFGADRENPGRSNEDPGKGGPGEPVDAQGCLERLALSSVIVPPYPNVEDPERGRVDTRRPGREVAGEQDETGAGRQHGEAVAQSLRERVPETRLDQETGDRGRLSSRQEKGPDASEVLAGANGEDIVARNDRGECGEMLRDVALERENPHLHPAARSSSMIAFARSKRT